MERSTGTGNHEAVTVVQNTTIWGLTEYWAARITNPIQPGNSIKVGVKTNNGIKIQLVTAKRNQTVIKIKLPSTLAH